MATRRAHTGRFASKSEASTAEAAHKLVQRRIDARAKEVGVKATTARPKLHRIFQKRLDELDLDNRDAKTIARNRTSFERFTRWYRAPRRERPAPDARKSVVCPACGNVP